MTFYGQVVDEEGYPVQGATVTMSVAQERMVGKKFLVKQTIVLPLVATTETLGAFVIRDATGWRFTLHDIKAEGYQFDTSRQPSLYFSPVTHACNLKAEYFFRQNKRFPVTLILVKDRSGS